MTQKKTARYDTRSALHKALEHLSSVENAQASDVSPIDLMKLCLIKGKLNMGNGVTVSPETSALLRRFGA